MSEQEKLGSIDTEKKTEEVVSDSLQMAQTIVGFLQSDQGNKLAFEVIEFFKDWKNQSSSLNRQTLWVATLSQLATLACVLGVALYATLNAKMDPVLAGLLGTVAGYVFGRKNS
ncbi:hypothetical protein KIK84_07900 [Curvibacter sp. CHRR-16]|uniref:hypothetical protein n=1 Tax=Curvibacter sp. CHRR-16 TaxID=2835872 RepID=UPI001BDABF0F|nr:hypothetical protein [Curvibacter sp. CHRR-16]MBT0570245.1 hypothetical protein [Curvibacter sp. CHRR-16]